MTESRCLSREKRVALLPGSAENLPAEGNEKTERPVGVKSPEKHNAR